MFKLLRKSIIFTAALALFVQTVGFAAPKTCSCHSGTACQAQATCRCHASAEVKHSCCPHCQKKAETSTSGDFDGNRVSADTACRCHLSLPTNGAPVFTPQTAELPALPSPASTISFLPVCCREWPSVDSFSAWLPDSNFRRIFLCVWLT
ncbi:hypothetical protein GC197_16410 [bacterium]|nr:hypothetical protein [bacterium]